jgi:hypothetical protein
MAQKAYVYSSVGTFTRLLYGARYLFHRVLKGILAWARSLVVEFSQVRGQLVAPKNLAVILSLFKLKIQIEMSLNKAPKFKNFVSRR